MWNEDNVKIYFSKKETIAKWREIIKEQCNQIQVLANKNFEERVGFRFMLNLKVKTYYKSLFLKYCLNDFKDYIKMKEEENAIYIDRKQLRWNKMYYRLSLQKLSLARNRKKIFKKNNKIS